MGVAYFIVLDREIAGVDAFVDGKAVAREGDRLAVVTQTLGLRNLNEFVSADPNDVLEMAEELGIDLPNQPPPEVWFAPEDGLNWVSQVWNYLTANPSAVGDANGVLADLDEYRALLDTAKANAV